MLVSLYLFQEMKSNDPFNPDDEEDLILMTPLDELITHKPTERKFDTLSGMIPFILNVSFKCIALNNKIANNNTFHRKMAIECLP